MCSRFLAKHSAFRRAASDVNHEQMSFRPMHATSVVEQSKEGAMYSCYVQDPTRYILADFYRLRSVYCPGSL